METNLNLLHKLQKHGISLACESKWAQPAVNDGDSALAEHSPMSNDR